jgi:hypothetical protein
MERNGLGPKDDSNPEVVEIAQKVNELLDPDSVPRDRLDSDDYDEEAESVDDYLQSPKRRAGSRIASPGQSS